MQNLYGLFLVLAFVISTFIAIILLKKSSHLYLNYLVLSSTLAFILSRAIFVLVNFQYYFIEVNYPISIFFFWDGGMSFFGVILSLIITIEIYKKKKYFSNQDVNIQNVLFTVIWLFIAIIRYAEKYTNVGIGKSINFNFSRFLLVNSMGIDFLAISKIEAIFAILMFFASLIIWYFNKDNKKIPVLKYIFLIIFCSSQILFESLRNDGHMLIKFIHVQQVLYAIVLVYSIFRLHTYISKERRSIIMLSILILILVSIDFTMEFVIDGRLHMPQLLNLNYFIRNYIIVMLVSIIFSITGLYKLSIALKKTTD